MQETNSCKGGKRPELEHLQAQDHVKVSRVALGPRVPWSHHPARRPSHRHLRAAGITPHPLASDPTGAAPRRCSHLTLQTSQLLPLASSPMPAVGKTHSSLWLLSVFQSPCPACQDSFRDLLRSVFRGSGRALSRDLYGRRLSHHLAVTREFEFGGVRMRERGKECVCCVSIAL